MNGTIVAPNRRRFDDEFKKRAVEMMESGERSARQLGKELGVSEWSLCHWRKQYRENAAGAGLYRISYCGLTILVIILTLSSHAYRKIWV